MFAAVVDADEQRVVDDVVLLEELAIQLDYV